MAEQAVWRLKQLALSIPIPSVAALRARAWLVGPPLLLGLLAALIASQLTTRVWRSEAKVFIAPGLSPLLNPSLLAEPQRGLETVVSLTRSPQLAGRVVRALAVPGLTARQFLRDSSVKPTPDSAVLAFSVSYPRRVLAVRLTNEYVLQFVRFFRERWRGPLPQARPRLNLVQQPSPPKPTVIALERARVVSSFRPHVLRNEILAAVFGALVGVALVVGVGVRRRSSD
jgi:capsular polysaccharide biosynthesis protein